MKRFLAICMAALMAAGSMLSSAEGYGDAAAFVQDIPTTQYFTDEAVLEEDITKILMAGVNAPSAINSQPWHFTAVTDAAVIEQMAGGMSFGGAPAGFAGGELPEGMQAPEGFDGAPEGFEGAPGGMPSMPAGGGAATTKAGLTDAPLVIVVSCKEGSELDADLALQTMYIEAQLLGYGAKILTSPTMTLNGERKAEFAQILGIPDGQSVVAVLLVGREDKNAETTVDAYTSATVRNPMDAVVTFVAP